MSNINIEAAEAFFSKMHNVQPSITHVPPAQEITLQDIRKSISELVADLNKHAPDDIMLPFRIGSLKGRIASFDSLIEVIGECVKHGETQENKVTITNIVGCMKSLMKCMPPKKKDNSEIYLKAALLGMCSSLLELSEK